MTIFDFQKESNGVKILSGQKLSNFFSNEQTNNHRTCNINGNIPSGDYCGTNLLV